MDSKNWLKALAGCCAVAFAANVFAAPGTLYEQEGTAADNDPIEVNAAGQAPDAATASWTNWKYQTGAGSWSGVYAGDSGWLTEAESGNMSVKVEADIEMYCTQTIANNEIYFHIGNVYTATTADCIAYIQGTMSSNNGQYVGISFDGSSKTAASFEKDTAGNFTGKILGGMVSKHDTWRTQDNAMDIGFLMNWGAGWQVPVNFGVGSHGTQQNVLWWAPIGPGTFNYQWQVRIYPVAHQADGDYYLDPVVVSAPVL